MLSRCSRHVSRQLQARAFSSASSLPANTPVIVNGARTPIGSFLGSLSALKAPELGTLATREALVKSGVEAQDVQEVFLGNVISAGLGQAPARQAAIRAGLPWSVPCTTVNKVCSSGMKAVMFGAQAVELGHVQCMVAGGFESMSNVPYLVPQGRTGYGYGHGQFYDGLLKDGLWDAFDDHHMGNCAEACAREYSITREEQDEFALESYARSARATEAGLFKDEIVPVEVKTRSGPTTISEDEEFRRLKPEKVPELRPAFQKDGTVTAANASTLNDGACSMVITSAGFAAERGLKPIARILGYGDAARPSIEFTTAPSLAIPKAIERAGISQSDVDFWEINEAFSVVALANAKLLGLDIDRLNVNGGGVSLGHPIGSSGARIILTLANVLRQRDASIGVAGICNGGGGASAIAIERLE